MVSLLRTLQLDIILAGGNIKKFIGYNISVMLCMVLPILLNLYFCLTHLIYVK